MSEKKDKVQSPVSDPTQGEELVTGSKIPSPPQSPSPTLWNKVVCFNINLSIRYNLFSL